MRSLGFVLLLLAGPSISFANVHLPGGNADALQPWDFDNLTFVKPARQLGEWSVVTRVKGDSLMALASSKFKTPDGTVFTGLYPIGGRDQSPSFIELKSSRTYLICGLRSKSGNLEFPSYGDPAQRARRDDETASVEGAGQSEVAIQAIFPWLDGNVIDQTAPGHSILCQLAGSLTSLGPSEIRTARHELEGLGVNSPRSKELRKWVITSLTDTLKQLRPKTPLQALSISGLLMTWKDSEAPAVFLDAVEKALADPDTEPQDIDFIARQEFTGWGGARPEWASGAEGWKKQLLISRKLIGIADSTQISKIHLFALDQITVASDDVRVRVFSYIDSPDQRVAIRALHLLSLWSNRPDREPVLGIGHELKNTSLVSAWKKKGPGAALSGDN